MFATMETRIAAEDPVPIFRRKTCGLDLATPTNLIMVRRYVAALSRSFDAVDDLAQEVFVRAIARLNRLASADKAAAFLRGIARLVVQEHFRESTRQRQTLDYDRALVQTLVADERESVLAACHDQQLQCALQEAVAELPLLSRRMLEMRYHDGANATEIGQLLGIEAAAVRVSLMRIRQRLAKRLARWQGDS